MSRNFKTLLVALLVVIIAGGAYAFAAANTIHASSAGYAGTTVSGYAVDNIVYDLNDINPTLVNKITFDLTADAENGAPAVTVKVQTTTPGDWKICNVTGIGATQQVTCTTTDLPLAEITTLNVIASSSANPTDGQ